MSLYGIDVSHWQGDIDFNAFKAAQQNCDFLIAKATEGEKRRDPKFYQNMTKCEQHGILRGAYHYVRGDVDWWKQTNNFLSEIYSIQKQPRDILLALDVEDRTLVERGVNHTQRLVSDMVTEIYDETGIYPLIYVSLGFMQLSMFSYDDVCKKCGGWIAAWGSAARNKPKRGDLNTSIWQYTSKGTIAGIKGAVDLDRAYMSRESWFKFANPGRK